MALLHRYWRWLGRWLRLSQPGRALFTAAFLSAVAEVVFVRAHGDREGGAPGVVLALALAGVVRSMPSAVESSRLDVVSQ